jgi:RecB family exonuclease
VEQLTLGGMPARLFACTPARLAAFDCPRRYRYAYIDRPPPPRGAPWAHNVVGAVVHLALAQWFGLPRPQRLPEHGADLVHENWQNLGFRDDAQSAGTALAAAAWVERYLGELDPRADPVGVERTVATRSERLAISGRVDRIDARGAELAVVDYKTGRHVPTQADAAGSPALALYVLGVRRTLRRPCRRVELHHLPTGTVATFEHDEGSLAEHLQRAEATAQQIQAAADGLAAGVEPDVAFPAAPSAACRWCDFRRCCPEGRAAAPEVASWAGLAEID